MVLPLAALLIGGGIFQGAQALTKRKTFSKKRDAAGVFVDSLDALCVEASIEQPGGLASNCLPGASRDFLREGIAAARNPDELADVMKRADVMLDQQFRVHSFNEERKYKWATLDQQRQASDNTLRHQELQREANLLKTDPTVIATEAALKRGEQVGVHPDTGHHMFVPIARTKRWQEEVDKAMSAGRGLSVSNRLAVSIIENGVIRDANQVGFENQRSLITQNIGAIKRAESLGALDQGVFLFTEGLVPSQTDVANFIAGSDAAVLERVQTTQQMFIEPYRDARSVMKTLPGITPTQRQRFDGPGQRYMQLQETIPQAITTARAGMQAGGGDIESQALLEERAGMSSMDRFNAEQDAEMRAVTNWLLRSTPLGKVFGTN